MSPSKHAASAACFFNRGEHKLEEESLLKFDTEIFAVCSDFFSEISSNKVETRNREGERPMAKGILRNKRKKGRLLAVAVLSRIAISHHKERRKDP